MRGRTQARAHEGGGGQRGDSTSMKHTTSTVTPAQRHASHAHVRTRVQRRPRNSRDTRRVCAAAQMCVSCRRWDALALHTRHRTGVHCGQCAGTRRARLARRPAGRGAENAGPLVAHRRPAEGERGRSLPAQQRGYASVLGRSQATQCPPPRAAFTPGGGGALGIRKSMRRPARRARSPCTGASWSGRRTQRRVCERAAARRAVRARAARPRARWRSPRTLLTGRKRVKHRIAAKQNY